MWGEPGISFRVKASLQIPPSIGLRYLCNLLRSAFGDDSPSCIAALGSQVDHPVSPADHFEIVLDYQNAAA